MEKYVVISTDANDNYYFFMPLVSIIWQKRIGYRPIILLVANKEELKKNRGLWFSVQCAKKYGAQIYMLSRMDEFSTSTVAQVARLFCGCLDFPESAYLLLSDIDMIPISKEYFNQQDWNADIHIFNSEAYHHDQYAICYIGMTVGYWRKIMKVSKEDLYNALNKQLINGLGKNNRDGYQAFSYDQHLFSQRLKKVPNYRSFCQMIPYDASSFGIYGGRIDRVDWKHNGYIDNYIDCHLLKPGYNPENWRKIKDVMRALMAENDLRFIERYYASFKKHRLYEGAKRRFSRKWISNKAKKLPLFFLERLKGALKSINIDNIGN